MTPDPPFLIEPRLHDLGDGFTVRRLLPSRVCRQVWPFVFPDHIGPVDRTRGLPMSRYASFREFYPFYLAEHANRNCRRLHFIGSALVLATLMAAIWARDARWLGVALLSGYGFAWIGHVVFEKNRPATFKHPFYSFVGDWVMFRDILRGRVGI